MTSSRIERGGVTPRVSQSTMNCRAPTDRAAGTHSASGRMWGMNSTVRGFCGVCGVALMGVTVAHVWIADKHGDERRQEIVFVTSAHGQSGHEDRSAESAVDLGIYARQVVAVATSSGDAPPAEGLRLQQEVARQWWKRSEREAWQRARSAHNFNLSGMDHTLPS